MNNITPPAVRVSHATADAIIALRDDTAVLLAVRLMSLGAGEAVNATVDDLAGLLSVTPDEVTNALHKLRDAGLLAEGSTPTSHRLQGVEAGWDL